MAVGRLGAITLDCADPQELGRFWADVTGGDVVFDSPDFVAVAPPGGVWITAVRVAEHHPAGFPDGAVGKQLHLDLKVDDLDVAQRAAEAAGARVADVQPAPDRWRVLLDPAGHPFCVTTQIPD